MADLDPSQKGGAGKAAEVKSGKEESRLSGQAFSSDAAEVSREEAQRVQQEESTPREESQTHHKEVKPAMAPSSGEAAEEVSESRPVEPRVADTRKELAQQAEYQAAEVVSRSVHDPSVRLEEILESEKLSDGEKLSTVALLLKNHGPTLTEQTSVDSLVTQLEQHFPREATAELKLILQQERAQARAVRIHRILANQKEPKEALVRALESFTPEQLKEIAEAYRERYGRALEADFEKNLGPDDTSDLQKIIVDPRGACVERVVTILTAERTSHHRVIDELEKLDPETRQEVKEALEAQYGKELQQLLEKYKIAPGTAADLKRVLELNDVPREVRDHLHYIFGLEKELGEKLALKLDKRVQQVQEGVEEALDEVDTLFYKLELDDVDDSFLLYPTFSVAVTKARRELRSLRESRLSFAEYASFLTGLGAGLLVGWICYRSDFGVPSSLVAAGATYWATEFWVKALAQGEKRPRGRAVWAPHKKKDEPEDRENN